MNTNDVVLVIIIRKGSVKRHTDQPTKTHPRKKSLQGESLSARPWFSFKKKQQQQFVHKILAEERQEKIFETLHFPGIWKPHIGALCHPFVFGRKLHHGGGLCRIA